MANAGKHELRNQDCEQQCYGGVAEQMKECVAFSPHRGRLLGRNDCVRPASEEDKENGQKQGEERGRNQSCGVL